MAHAAIPELPSRRQWKARPAPCDNDISPAITTRAAKAYHCPRELHLKLNNPSIHISPPPSCPVRHCCPSKLVSAQYIC
jgi:hypothetical protein